MLADIPPPKADFSAPPPYELATKLPSYEEAQQQKMQEQSRVNQQNKTSRFILLFDVWIFYRRLVQLVILITRSHWRLFWLSTMICRIVTRSKVYLAVTLPSLLLLLVILLTTSHRSFLNVFLFYLQLHSFSTGLAFCFWCASATQLPPATVLFPDLVSPLQSGP